MTFESLVSDFFRLEKQLPQQQLDKLLELRRYLEKDVKPHVNKLWEDAEFPHEIVEGLSRTKLMGMSWPETWPFETTSVFRGWVALELARIDASIATYVGVHNGLAMGAIGTCGSQEQRDYWLPKMHTGDIVGSFGLTEPLSGSDAAGGLRTTATRTGDSWTINGSKRWIGNATWANICIIWAKDTQDNNVKGFIVPTDSPGFVATKIEGKQSLRIVQNADITLTNVEVPENHRLQNAHTFQDTAAVLRNTRTEVAWASVGVAIGAYEAALKYATERKQFGKPLASFQLVQDLLVKSLGNITSSLSMVLEASRMQDAGELSDEHASLAKAVATTRMRETVSWCREILGGNGIVVDYDVARFFADAEALYSYEGTREINTLIVGRAITGIAAFV